MLNKTKHQKFDLQYVYRLSDGLEKLNNIHADVILLDLGLPDSKGLDTFFILHEKFPELPIVVLTVLDYEAFGRRVYAWYLSRLLKETLS